MNPAPIRCRGKLHAVLVSPGVIEVKCDSRVCGAGGGVIVLHRFNMDTGETTTIKFKDPRRKVTA